LLNLGINRESLNYFKVHGVDSQMTVLDFIIRNKQKSYDKGNAYQIAKFFGANARMHIKDEASYVPLILSEDILLPPLPVYVSNVNVAPTNIDIGTSGFLHDDDLLKNTAINFPCNAETALEEIKDVKQNCPPTFLPPKIIPRATLSPCFSTLFNSSNTDFFNELPCIINLPPDLPPPADTPPPLESISMPQVSASQAVEKNVKQPEEKKDWTDYRKSIPAETTEWVNYFKDITKMINANLGYFNCAHCAFRVNEIIANGFTIQPPVPVENAMVEMEPVWTTATRIKRTFCSDLRLVSVVPFEKTSEVEDLSHNDKIIIELDVNHESRRIKFLKVQKTDLIDRLRETPRRNKDGSAYGFIVLTTKNKKDTPRGHIINYFVTPDNDVLFIDAQQYDNEKNRVTTKIDFLKRFINDVFFINAMPPEGFRIKSEKAVKQEPQDDGQKGIKRKLVDEATSISFKR
jgi:hypothetical protein